MNARRIHSVRAFEAADHTRALGLIARRRGVVTRFKIARPREHGLPRPPRLLVELVAHPRLLDRPEVQTFIRLHEAVAREVADRRYCYRDTEYSCYRIDHRAAEVGVRSRRVDDVGGRGRVVVLVETRPQTSVARDT